MTSRAAKYVTYGQWNLIVFVLVCVSLHPGLVLKGDEGGFSNYGIHIKTAIPYSLTYLICIAFTLVAINYVPRTTRAARTLVVLLYSYCVLCLFILVSTYGYTLNQPLRDVHGAFGLVAMIFDPAVSVWLFLQVKESLVARVYLGIEIAGVILGIIDIVNAAHVLFAAQATVAFGFGLLLVRGTRRIVRESDEGAVLDARAHDAGARRLEGSTGDAFLD
jgi:hypothetical protein